jgi:aminomethyltransferase
MAAITIGSRIAKSPYYPGTLAAGATHYTIYNRMYMPTSYGDPLGEYERLMTGVSIWDVGAERQVEIAGPDARAFVDYVSCRSLASLKVGRGRYTPMCNYAGVLINDPIAMPIDEDRWWLSIADSDVLLHCQAVAGAKGFDVTVREPDVSPLAIQGPKAQDLCRDLFGDIVDEIGFFHFRPVEVDGIPIVLMRSGWSRQGGFELFLTDGAKGMELWELAFAAGEPYDAAPGTPHQMERIEHGLLSYGADTDDDTDPIEANLGKWVDLDGDDFVGKAALVARQEQPDQRRLLVNVDIDGDMPAPEHPWPATCQGAPAGELRTATWSPKLGRNVGLALVPTACSAPGTILDVDADGRGLTVTVSSVPFGDNL